jgi:hypothetical protein
MEDDVSDHGDAGDPFLRVSKTFSAPPRLRGEIPICVHLRKSAAKKFYQLASLRFLFSSVFQVLFHGSFFALSQRRI